MIQDLALMLVVAGIVTIIFKKLKQPLVLGYIMAGFLVSPHMPYTASVADQENIHLWADIGVMFLLFSLGLDFSFKKILKMGASPIISTVTIIFCMAMLGILVGQGFGWSRMDCISSAVCWPCRRPPLSIRPSTTSDCASSSLPASSCPSSSSKTSSPSS